MYFRTPDIDISHFIKKRADVCPWKSLTCLFTYAIVSCALHELRKNLQIVYLFL